MNRFISGVLIALVLPVGVFSDVFFPDNRSIMPAMLWSDHRSNTGYLLQNPAGIQLARTQEFGLSHETTIFDYTHLYGGYILPISFLSIGIAGDYLSSDGIPLVSARGSNNRPTQSGSFSDRTYRGAIVGAFAVSDSVQFGNRLNVYGHTLHTGTATGLSIDVGVLWTVNPNWDIGYYTQNFFKTELEWSTGLQETIETLHIVETRYEWESLSGVLSTDFRDTTLGAAYAFTPYFKLLGSLRFPGKLSFDQYTLGTAFTLASIQFQYGFVQYNLEGFSDNQHILGVTIVY